MATHRCLRCMAPGQVRIHFRAAQQIQKRHSEALDNAIGQFRREFSHALQYVMDLRLGDLQDSGESTFAEITVRNAVIYKPNESCLEYRKGDRLMA